MKVKKTLVIVAPNVLAQLSGAYRVDKTAHTTTLTYLDGTKETVDTARLPNSLDWDSWFSIVGGVQSLREEAGR